MTATAVETPEPDDTAETGDLVVLMPGTRVVDVEGFPCRVRRMRSREVLDLARILGTGLGNAIADVDFDFSDVEQFKADITAMLMIALPNAENEVFAFISKIVVPEDTANAGRVATLMQNPALDVVFDVLDAVLEQEGPGVVGLLGKARSMAGRVRTLLPKTPAPKTPAKSSTGGSAGRSRGRST